MKKLLLLFLIVMVSGFNALFAQNDTIDYLIISEVRMDALHHSYMEITNMSETQAIDLGTIEIGAIDCWDQPYIPQAYQSKRLPSVILWPGESYVIATLYDLPNYLRYVDPERWEPRLESALEWWGDNPGGGPMADLQLHVSETTYGTFPQDSVTEVGRNALINWNGRQAWYLRQHINETDSVVIDAIAHDFTEGDGTGYTAPKDVAGVEDATVNSTLIRKFSIKKGDILGDDWDQQAGVDIADSEWLPIPLWPGPWGPEAIKIKLPWTIGNHGDFHLTPQTLVSSTIDVNWTDTVMTVPWGVRNDYRVMDEFEYSPGIQWVIDFSENREDSAFTSFRTGDVLTMYAAGNTLEIWPFDIVVADPTEDANIVVPKNALNNSNEYSYHPFNVTIDAPDMDTIYDVGWATRKDTLFKYLEKAPEASWVLVFVDGAENRPDLVDGDILKVTAADNSVKEYYIKVDDYLPSHNAELASITWRDMPETFKQIGSLYGWTGDTIPKFSASTHLYSFKVPPEADGIPALAATPQELNTTFTIDRALTLDGSLDDRTVKINTVAEDDTSFLTYSVVLEPEEDASSVTQPWQAEPFFSERCNREQWSHSAMEIVNVGTVDIDMSNYMLVRGQDEGTPAAALMDDLDPEDFAPDDDPTSNSGEDMWGRYNHYVPGFVWTSDEAEWQSDPGKLIPDPAVNPFILPGDVFVAAAFNADGTDQHHWMIDEFDVYWGSDINLWGDTTLYCGQLDWMVGGNPVRGWTDNTYYLFKMVEDPLVRDSIKTGKKWVGDPNDWDLIDVWGPGDASAWSIAGTGFSQTNQYIRKPHIWHGNPEYNGSFGTNAEDSEWIIKTSSDWSQQGYGWPWNVRMVMSGMGAHTFDPVTFYMSTVKSAVYRVSGGFSMEEEITGLSDGTTVADFLQFIVKLDEDQELTVKSASTGGAITGTETVLNGDSLIVVSANGENTTKYILGVTNDLSSDALLTSAVYDIAVDGSEGTVSGFDMGTTLQEVRNNVVVPAAAALTCVDANDSWVTYKKVNYDTTMVDVLATERVFFEVRAEDFVTVILYQLLPTSASSDAYVESIVYAVDQDASNIMYVPRGTAVGVFLGNLIPATGATVKLVDKNGNERTTGHFYQDDKVVVTAEDGVTQKVYFISTLRRDEDDVPDYLAYVTSAVYDVDQLVMDISGGITGTTNLQDFIGNLIPSFGAQIVVINSQGVENTTDDLDQGDVLKVTSADGEIVVYYAITGDWTSIDELSDGDIHLYPNPTTGEVNIRGIENGSRIRVFNSMGALIRDIVAGSSIETVNLDNEATGMYLFIVNESSFKVIRE